MKLRLLVGAAAFAAVSALSPAPASAGGLWPTIPGVGASSFCAAYVTGLGLPTAQGPFGVVPGNTQGSSVGICAQTVPAGPSVFAGTEYVPADIPAQGSTNTSGAAQTAAVSLLQLGQGPMVDLTTVATANTIPLNTPWYFLDGAQGSALTVTMPATAIEGQIQHIVCEAATVGTMTVAANTSVVTQVLKGNPNAACVAGVGYAWRYQASNLTWYRIQ